MDREFVDRISAELLARISTDSGANPEREMAKLRSDGHSIVESVYIISNVFNISLIDAKGIAMEIEPNRDKLSDLQERISDN